MILPSILAKASCFPDHCFCEKAVSGILQPINTWSSLAYCAVGILIIVLSYVATRNKFNAVNKFYSKLRYGLIFGSSLIVLGVSSAVFHASLSFWGGFADVIGMYLMSTFLLVYGLSRLKNYSETRTWSFYAFLNMTAAISVLRVEFIGDLLFAFIMIAAFIAEFKITKAGGGGRRLLSWIFIILVFAFLVWITDKTGVLCYPDSIYQGHAVWHIFSALAAGMAYWYYTSEHDILGTWV